MLWTTKVLSFIAESFSDHGHKARSPAKNRTSAKKQLLQNILQAILSCSIHIHVYCRLSPREASIFLQNKPGPTTNQKVEEYVHPDTPILQNHFSLTLQADVSDSALSLIAAPRPSPHPPTPPRYHSLFPLSDFFTSIFLPSPFALCRKPKSQISPLLKPDDFSAPLRACRNSSGSSLLPHMCLSAAILKSIQLGAILGKYSEQSLILAVCMGCTFTCVHAGFRSTQGLCMSPVKWGVTTQPCPVDPTCPIYKENASLHF